MKAALGLIGDGLVRALSPAIDRAVRERAEAVAQDLAADGSVTARVLRRGAGDYAVTVAGEDLFARAFGSVEREAEPVIGSVLRRARSL